MPSTLSQEESRVLAQHIVEAFIAQLSNEATVNALAGVWGKQLDQWIGKGFRRFAFYVLCGAVLLGAVKLQVWNYLAR